MAEEGVSILETESYIVALVFLIFLVLFVATEKLLEWRQANLTRRHKVGLLAALDAVKLELMLFGVASLLLKVLEDSITSICMPVPSSHPWTILSQLNGCECCLENTKGVSECFLEGSDCGANFCNCNNANPSCLADQQASKREAAGTDSEEQCAGFAQYSVRECGYRPGYKQALTSRSISQIHTMLFYIAVVHIVCSVVMYRIANARIRIWKKWLSDEDATSTAVNVSLQRFQEAAVQKEQRLLQAKVTPQGEDKLPVWRRLQSLRSLSRSKKRNLIDTDGTKAAEPNPLDESEAHPSSSTSLGGPPPGLSAEADSIHLHSADRVQNQNEAGAAGTLHKHVGNMTLNGRGNGDVQVSARGPPDSRGSRTQAAVQPLLKPEPSQKLHDAIQMLTKTHASPASKPTIHGEVARLSHQVSVPQTEVEVYLADEAAEEAADGVVDEAADAATAEAAEDAASMEQDHTALDIRLPDEVVVQHSEGWTGRRGKLDKRRQHTWEWTTCFLRQFRMQTLQPAEVSIMRASFILTHRPGRKFNFMKYILASLDDDCAKVVGLGWTVWLVVIVFVLLAGVIGWSAAWFELLALILELVMNTRLIHIARHTARGGTVHRLKPTIFWFGAKGPWVMLLAIKTLLFLVSFIFASLIFFAVNFGAKSCFFATPGLNTASLPVPWWAILVVNVLVYFALSFVTLPLYSLGVQMGSGFRQHILTPNVKNRLLDIAHANKQKVGLHAQALTSYPCA
ncbi:Mlo15p, variant 2 [Trebouxia sp. C0010 RCD-2024]